jgi:mannose-6-phosphate isomerase-like protein (cupin superfamily)
MEEKAKNYIVCDADAAEHFKVGDECQLAELMHPLREKLSFSSLSLSHAFIGPHGKTVPHRLAGSSEIYYILSGRAKLFVEDDTIELAKGRAIAIAPFAVQHVENDSDEKLEFLCIVTPPWKKENEEII